MHAAFPTDYELLAFFGAEPKVLDPEVPWFYNTLDFETERHGIDVHCKIVPSTGDISVRMYLRGEEITRLEVRLATNVALVANSEGQALVASLGDETFALVLEPRVWVGLGKFHRILPHD